MNSLLCAVVGLQPRRPTIDTAVPKSEEPTEVDWLFEYIDSVMKSPAWESEVMGFIDDNCMIFDNEEENKFEHTVVHNKFQEVTTNESTSTEAQIGASHLGLFPAVSSVCYVCYPLPELYLALCRAATLYHATSLICFKQVVDGLLMAHLEDVNVTPEAFAEACERAR